MVKDFFGQKWEHDAAKGVDRPACPRFSPEMS